MLPAPDPDSVRVQTKKILASKPFHSSKRLRHLLEFLINETLAGRDQKLTSSVIATECFEDEDDVTVRREAGRLRSKLLEYYDSEGRSDLIRIDMPKGSYVPVFVAPTGDPSSAPMINVFNAYQEQRWSDVIAGAEQVLAANPELSSKFERMQVPAVQLARLAALTTLRYFDQINWASTSGLKRFLLSARNVGRDLETPSVWGDFYPRALAFSLVLFEKSGQSEAARKARHNLLNLLDNAQDSVEAAEAVIDAAIGLKAEDQSSGLCESALQLLSAFVDRIRTRRDPAIRKRWAHAHKLIVRYLIDVGRSAQAFEHYSSVAPDLDKEDGEGSFGDVAWAGTEATRALRDIGRESEADTLALALEKRYGRTTDVNAQTAVCWALAERSNTLFNAKQFLAAAELCSSLISTWENRNSESALHWPITWTYARLAQSLEKAGRYSEALAACQSAIDRFGASSDVDVQFEIAWILNEKAVALRRLKRLTTSVTTAREVALRFGNAIDQRISNERVWAIHVEADTTLCEAKLLMQSGLEEDSRIRLERAVELLHKATQQDQTEPDHLGCMCYAQYLLGRKDESKVTFAKALKLGGIEWMERNDWAEIKMFSLPEDVHFTISIQEWCDRFRQRQAS